MYNQLKSTTYTFLTLLIIGMSLYIGSRLIQPDSAAADPITIAATVNDAPHSITESPTNLPEASFDVSFIDEIKDTPTSQVQQVNGITLELNTIQRDSEFVQVAICYQLPSEADWLLSRSPNDVLLTFEDKTIALWGESLIEWKKAPDGTKTHRCNQLWFPVTVEQDLSQFTVTIKRLVTSEPEQPDCNAAQEKLEQAKTGIQIQCEHGESMFGYTIVQQPSTMSEGEAHQVVADAFRETILGPWIFTTGLK